MIALTCWCAVLGWIGLHRQVTGSDSAGNGMATGFIHGFAEAGLELAAFLVGLYLLCRRKPVRYICITMIALLGIGMILLVR
jgi:hypothetical protein